MEGRVPPAIRLVYTRCTDPAQRDAFNHWYAGVHIPDMVRTGLVDRGLRYRNAEPSHGEPDYLAVYELRSDDFAGIQAGIRAAVDRFRAQGRMHPAIEVLRLNMWRRAGPAFAPAAQGRAGGLFIVESSCTQPDRLDEFRTWYDTIHIPDLLATAIFTHAYRFEAPPGQQSGRFLAIYETVGDPVEAVNRFVRDHRPRLKAAGRLSDIIDVTYRGVFASV